MWWDKSSANVANAVLELEQVYGERFLWFFPEQLWELWSSAQRWDVWAMRRFSLAAETLIHPRFTRRLFWKPQQITRLFFHLYGNNAAAAAAESVETTLQMVPPRSRVPPPTYPNGHATERQWTCCREGTPALFSFCQICPFPPSYYNNQLFCFQELCVLSISLSTCCTHTHVCKDIENNLQQLKVPTVCFL